MNFHTFSTNIHFCHRCGRCELINRLINSRIRTLIDKLLLLSRKIEHLRMNWLCFAGLWSKLLWLFHQIWQHFKKNCWSSSCLFWMCLILEHCGPLEARVSTVSRVVFSILVTLCFSVYSEVCCVLLSKQTIIHSNHNAAFGVSQTWEICCIYIIPIH